MVKRMVVDYFQTPNAIFETELTIYQKIVYIYLCRRGNQGGDAYPGYGRIARDCGMSKPQAKRAVKVLEDNGYIGVTRRRKSERLHDTNLYKVNYQIGGICEIPGVVSEGYQGGVCEIPKEEPIKKNNNKKSTPLNLIEEVEPNLKDMVSLYYQLIEKATGEKPIQQWARDSSVLKKAADGQIMAQGVDKVKAKLEAWFANDNNGFLRSKGYPLALFATQYNNIVTRSNQVNDLPNYTGASDRMLYGGKDVYL